MPARACQVAARVTVPVERAAGLLFVTVQVNGQPVRTVLDTGAERSVIGLAAADRVGLRQDEWVSTDTQGTGGRDRRRLGRPDTLALGGLPLRRHTVAADDSLVVGPLPDGVDGLLGQDMLSPYDLELDPVRGSATLWSVAGCSGAFIPWAGEATAIGLWNPAGNMLAVALHLGDQPLMAELDTGASRTTLTRPGMVALGIAAGGGDRLRGFGAGSVAGRMQDFPAVAVGGLPSQPMELMVAPLPTLRSIGALLGADWLGGRHVWISWATRQLFVAH